MTPGFAKPRAELPWLPYKEHDRVIINSHNFSSGSASLQDCLHAWHAAQDSGATATDQFGSLDGTLTGATRVDDGTGMAYSFRQAFEDRITTIVSSLGAANTVTVCMWIKPTAVDTRQGIFSTREGNIAGSWGFEVGAGSGGTGRLAATTPGVFNAETNSGIITAGVWQHVLFERDGSSQGFFVNGSSVALAVNSPVTFVDNSSAKQIGRVNTSGSSFGGLQTDILVFGRILTTAEKSFLASVRGAIYT